MSGSQALELQTGTPRSSSLTLNTLSSFTRSHSTHSFPTTFPSSTRIPQQQHQQERSRSLSPISYQTSPNQSFPNGLNTLNPAHRDHRSGVEGSFASQQTAVAEGSSLANPTNNGLKFATHTRLAASSSSINTCSTSSSPEFNESTKIVTPNRSKSPPFRNHSSSPDLFLSTLSLDSANSLMSGSLSAARLSSSAVSGSSNEKKTEMAVLDLYLLKQNTDFYHQLYAVWKDFNIVRPLLRVLFLTYFTSSSYFFQTHTLGTYPPKPPNASTLSQWVSLPKTSSCNSIIVLSSHKITHSLYILQ